MRYFTNDPYYRRGPWSVIVSRIKRHFIHSLAFIGAAALVYGYVHGGF